MQVGSVQEVASCKGCGYALRALPEHRCPECGRAFDPADLATMDVPWRPGFWKWLRKAAAGVPDYALLLTALVVVWVGSCIGPFAGLFWPILIALLACRRWKVGAGCVVFSPMCAAFVWGVLCYCTGNAVLKGVGLPSDSAFNLDRETRLRKSIGGCIATRGEWVWIPPNNAAVRMMTAVFGPQRGAYAGPYPTEQQAIDALASAEAVDAQALLNDRLTLSTGAYALMEGVGGRILKYSPFDPEWAPLLDLADADRKRLGPVKAVLWQSGCLIIRVPLEPGRAGTLVRAAAAVVLVDPKTSRPFAAYLDGTPRGCPTLWLYELMRAK